MTKSFLRRVWNRLLHQLARLLPGATSFRPSLHRLRGVKIHGKVFIGDDVYLENEYPECVEIHDGVQIGLRTTIISHTRGPSASSSLNFGVEAFQFHTGIFNAEWPVNPALFGIRLVRPGCNGSLQFGSCTNAAIAQTLAR